MIIKGIIINGYEPNNAAHDDNISIIKELSNIPIVAVIPKLKDVDTEKLSYGNMTSEFEKRVDLTKFIELMSEV